MGKAQRFERRLQGMVGDAFARVFGGSVVPQEVAQALQREADDNARPLVGGRVLAPNSYTVTLGATDHDRLAGDEQRVIRMLRECVQGHLREHTWDVYGDVVVSLKRSPTLHTGQFRTSSSVEPDAPQPRIAGDRAMTQHPGEYPEDGWRGQYGQRRGYSYDQGQGGYDVDPQHGLSYGYDSQSAQDQDYRNQGYYPQHGDQSYGADQNHPYPAVQTGAGRLAASLTLDDGSNRQYQLTEGATVVGRGQDAQFRLPDTGVSRRHLEITWDGRTAMLADLGSTNGTMVNGTSVHTWQLADGDVVRVGHSSLVFRAQG